MSITLVTKGCHKRFSCLILIAALGKGKAKAAGGRLKFQDTWGKGAIKERGFLLVTHDWDEIVIPALGEILDLGPKCESAELSVPGCLTWRQALFPALSP